MSTTSTERSRAWYEANASRYDRRHPGLSGDLTFYASLAHALDVLEVGAGTGRVTAALAAVAGRVVALDHSPAMLAIAARRLHTNRNVDLILADARHPPLRTGFDLVILAYRTVQHFDTDCRRRLWRDARSRLRPGGRIAFDTWHGPLAQGRDPNDITLNPVSVRALRQELQHAGLRVISLRPGFGATLDATSLTKVWVAVVC